MEHIDNIPSPVLFGEAWELKALFQQYVDIDEAKRLKHSFYTNTRENPYVAEVKHAINERFYVGIYYEEESDEVLNGFRLIEPYAYGLGYVHPQTKETLYPNRQYLRAYVIMDTEKDDAAKKKFHTKRTSVSLTDRAPWFRLFRTDRITSWFVFPKRFSRYRDFYNPDDKMMRRVLASLPYDAFPYGKIE